MWTERNEVAVIKTAERSKLNCGWATSDSLSTQFMLQPRRFQKRDFHGKFMALIEKNSFGARCLPPNSFILQHAFAFSNNKARTNDEKGSKFTQKCSNEKVLISQNFFLFCSVGKIAFSPGAQWACPSLRKSMFRSANITNNVMMII